MESAMNDLWQSFAFDDVPLDSLPEDCRSFGMDDKMYHMLKLPKNTRIQCLRLDKSLGFIPPYCATAPEYFRRNTLSDGAKLGPRLKVHKSSPLRNIVLSNVREWSLTGALEPSPPCPFALPHPMHGNSTYEARRMDGIDRVAIPKRLLNLVRQDYFDKQKATQNEFRSDRSSPTWTRASWAQMNSGNGQIQVVRYSRKTFSKLSLHPHCHQNRHQHRPKGNAAKVISQYSIQALHRNWFQNPRQKQGRRVLFRKSVEFEAEDVSWLLDEKIRKAMRMSAKIQFELRQSMLRSESQGRPSNYQKFYKYHLEPAEFMLCVKSEMERREAEQNCLKQLRKASWEGESGLDGLWAKQCYSETTMSSSEMLFNEYVEAFKLWPSPSGREERMERNNESSRLGRKRKLAKMARCSRISKKSKVGPAMLESVILIEPPEGAAGTPMCIFKEQPRRVLEPDFGDIFKQEFNLDYAAQNRNREMGHECVKHRKSAQLDVIGKIEERSDAAVAAPPQYQDKGGHDSGYYSTKEKPERKKVVHFGETVQVHQINPESAVKEQSSAYYPEPARCKDWDGQACPR